MPISRVFRKKSSQQGFILLTTLLVLMSLTVLGIAVIFLTGAGDESAVNDRAGQQALFAAEAGAQWGMQQVKASFQLATAGCTMGGYPTSPAGTCTSIGTGGYEYVRDANGNIQVFPGGNQAKFAVNIQPGNLPNGIKGVQCGLVGFSDQWGTFNFQIDSAGWGPGNSSRIVEAYVSLPPQAGLCGGSQVTGGYSGGG